MIVTLYKFKHIFEEKEEYKEFGIGIIIMQTEEYLVS